MTSPTIKTIFQAQTEPSFFESIAARSNGTLLITRQDTNELWEVDPVACTGRCVLSISGVESLTGMTEVLPDIFAVGGGTYRVATHEGPVPGSFSVWLVDFASGNEPQVRQVAATPEIGQLNGIERWDNETILAADSYFGKIYRISLANGSSTVCIDNETTNDPPNSPVRMGVNGLKVRQIGDQKYLYYSNTTRMIYCRMPVDDKTATATGPAEVLSSGFSPESMMAASPAFAALPAASIPDSVANFSSLPAPSEGFMPDDFCFAEDGATYATTHPTNMVVRIPPHGGVATKIAGGFTSWEVASATACAFGRTEADKHVLYVTTAGANVIPINGKTEPAKVLAIYTTTV